MKRVALLTECRPYDPNRSFEEQLVSVGGNTGNNAYITALKDIFGAAHVNYGQLDKTLEQDEYDIYIVGNLSWIVENRPVPDFYYDALQKILKKGKKFVPISVGTQVAEYKSNFQYHSQTLKMLKEVSEQAVLACRGEYTAELLKKNGIHNVEVVGCPSLFHPKDPDFKIFKKDRLERDAKVATGITPWPNGYMTSSHVQKFFMFVKQHKVDFIEQASMNWIDSLGNSDPEFKKSLQEYIDEYLKIFFDIEEWREYSRNLDFSFGARFHGNVIPLLEGVPALFITIDARTKEMCEYFQFPTIDIKDFDFNTSIEQLYEMTDYSEFNKNYRELYNRFENFARKNDLEIVY